MKTVTISLDEAMSNWVHSNYTPEEFGVFWRLLLWQAKDDGLNDNLEELAARAKCTPDKFVVIWDKIKGQFKPHPKKAGYIYNVKMSKSQSQETQTTWKAPMPSKMSPEELKQTFPGFEMDFEPIWRSFPKRKNKEEGHVQGVKWCRYNIKSDDEYQQLEAAAANYGRHIKETYKGQQERWQFTHSFPNWLKSWQDWIPSKSVMANKPKVKLDPDTPMDIWVRVAPPPPWDPIKLKINPREWTTELKWEWMRASLPKDLYDG